MGNHTLDRRQLLTAAGAGVAATAAWGGTAEAATGREGGGGLTGGWLISRTDEGSPDAVTAVITFAAGGAFQALDIDPAAPPLAGTWERASHRGFVAVFWGSADDGQGDVGTVRVGAVGRHDGNRIAGTYSVHVSIGSVTQDGTGTFHGNRIVAR